MVWKIGAITRKTGLTARAVHFYEESGLIGLVGRTESGHRVYDRKNLLKLQHIQTLKILGFSLSDIKPILEGNAVTLKSSIEELFCKVEHQRNTLTLIAARLNQLSSLLLPDTQSDEDMDEVLFKLMDTLKMYERYFSADTIEKLHRLISELGQSEGENNEEIWNTWIDSLKSLITEIVPPTDQRAQHLVNEWKQLLMKACEGDEKKIASISGLLNSESQARADHGITEEMFEYLTKATGCREPF